MAKVFGAELAKQIEKHRQCLVDAQDRRDERIGAGWTDEDDCFLSIRVEQQGIRECDMQLEILKGDGLMDVDAIFDENGKEVGVHSFPNKWGRISYVGHGIFASSIDALLKKTGWINKTIRVPVWTKFCAGSGGGMCAVYTGTIRYVRWHTNMVTGEYVGYPD